jgi:hypothetical protein
MLKISVNGLIVNEYIKLRLLNAEHDANQEVTIELIAIYVK